jgi:hypothetical protein
VDLKDETKPPKAKPQKSEVNPKAASVQAVSTKEVTPIKKPARKKSSTA